MVDNYWRKNIFFCSNEDCIAECICDPCKCTPENLCECCKDSNFASNHPVQ